MSEDNRKKVASGGLFLADANRLLGMIIRVFNV